MLIITIKVAFIFIFNLSNFVKNGLSYSYYFDKGPFNLIQAVQICNNLNASLYVPDDATESATIEKAYLGKVQIGIWIGIYDFSGNENNVNYCTNNFGLY
jgi:hypothetical protein